MQINIAAKAPRTHEGGPATPGLSAEAALRRSVMACMLWEDTFYESGEDISARIRGLIPLVAPERCVEIAVEARGPMKLRHAPLLIAREMARLPAHKGHVAATLAAIIQRPDEITEFLAIYWKDGRQPLSAQVKRGLAAAFRKFNEYSLAKYDRDGKVKLRDALFLCHAKPSDALERRWTKLERKAWVKLAVPELSPGEALFAAIVDRTLETPDTWEVALSSGADKKETFIRLIAEEKLGALALLRNLRNMRDSGVDKALIAIALGKMDAARVLPFRFIAAARAVPEWEDIIEPAMLRAARGMPKLPGRTLLLVDVSGSMEDPISGKSDLKRIDAACGLGILLREIAEDVAITTFSDRFITCPPRRGFALRDAIVASQPHAATYLGAALKGALSIPCDRIIVITDEQAHDAIPGPHAGVGWVINVAPYRNGVGYGPWNHIDGWSEAVLDFIRRVEGEDIGAEADRG